MMRMRSCSLFFKNSAYFPAQSGDYTLWDGNLDARSHSLGLDYNSHKLDTPSP